MQPTLIIILVGVLIISSITFCVLGLKNWRRTRMLARDAYDKKLHFSVNDLFDIPLRYRKFSLIESGHSPRAHNIAYGNINRMPVRAFDFFYELAHGPRRNVRWYSTVIIETSWQIENVILWSRSDIENAPIEFRHSKSISENWRCLGELGTAERLARLLADLKLESLTMEVLDNTILLAVPYQTGKSSYFDILDRLPRMIDGIETLAKQKMFTPA